MESIVRGQLSEFRGRARTKDVENARSEELMEKYSGTKLNTIILLFQASSPDQSTDCPLQQKLLH
ncbi:hypothetical protein E2C01_004333 [Portunus trituberculatus]|uniref:Uncharacterized protein n=1 Tax=Portunus trituberculatus TaxID=210409 RepID=A0A5B7CPP9_PORTR|nr:hypothetical protein [Portunus trituberculatus]